MPRQTPGTTAKDEPANDMAAAATNLIVTSMFQLGSPLADALAQLTNVHHPVLPVAQPKEVLSPRDQSLRRAAAESSCLIPRGCQMWYAG